MPARSRLRSVILDQLRLHFALRLLAERLPFTTVGHRCGWSTTSAFIDTFRRALGQTPGRSFRMPHPAG